MPSTTPYASNTGSLCTDDRIRAEAPRVSEDPVALLFTLVLVVMLAALSARTVADPDLPGHLLFGKDTLANLTPLADDPYSFTSDRQWVNHEWLAELLMALGFLAGGTVGLALLRTAVVVAALFVVSRTLWKNAVGLPVRLGLLTVAALGMLSQATVVRPQLFSLLCFALVLAILMDVERGRPRSLACLPVVFAAWANLHGGWIVGLGVVGLWAAVGCITGTKWQVGGSAIALSLIGTLLTPYGIALWKFMGDTVGLGRPHIQDWQPMIRTPSHLLPWGIAVVLVLAACRRLRGAAYFRLLPVLALGILSLRVVRLDVFFVLAAVVLLSPTFVGLGPSTFPTSHPATRTERRVATGLVAAACAAVAAHAVAASRCLPFDGAALRKPWAPEAEAVLFLRENHLRGRLLSFFDYGQYAIWHLYPDLKVSYDGRRETVYSDTVQEAHSLFYLSEKDVSYADRLRADYIWLPNWLPVVTALTRGGWVPLFKGERSTVFGRSEGVYTQPSAFVGPRCFPGP